MRNLGDLVTDITFAVRKICNTLCKAMYYMCKSPSSLRLILMNYYLMYVVCDCLTVIAAVSLKPIKHY